MGYLDLLPPCLTPGALVIFAPCRNAFRDSCSNPTDVLTFIFLSDFGEMVLQKLLTFQIFALLLVSATCAPLMEEPDVDALSQSPFELNYTTSTNLSTPENGRLTCYADSDPLFFSLMASKYNHFDCIRQMSRLGRKLSQADPSDINFWYTPTYKKPLGLRDPAFQMPVFHNDSRCSAAILSTKVLDQFTRDNGIAWREEWGGRRRWEIAPQVVTAAGTAVARNNGLWGLLDCFQQGRATMAGHILSRELLRHS